MTKTLDYAIDEWAVIRDECMNCASEIYCDECSLYKRGWELDQILVEARPVVECRDMNADEDCSSCKFIHVCSGA